MFLLPYQKTESTLPYFLVVTFFELHHGVVYVYDIIINLSQTLFDHSHASHSDSSLEVLLKQTRQFLTKSFCSGPTSAGLNLKV